jgi:hypothetical protein
MMQMGYAVESYFYRAGEFVMYEAAVYQFFQATACMVALDWATKQGYCLNDYIKELPTGDLTDPDTT